MSSSVLGWDASMVAAGVRGTRFGGRVQHFASVSSTSTMALEAAHAGAPEGGVWVADEQTAGRGRGGHTWHSEPGLGLYVSVLLRPALPAGEALFLSLATGLAVQSAVLEETGTIADLRWPNDLMFGEKKFGGILVETALAPDSTLRHAVIGIGINVGHAEFPDHLALIATSVLLATGRACRRESLLATILRALERELAALESGGGEAGLRERFSDASSWVRGKQVRVGEQDGYTGVTAGLDERGLLRVHDDDGTMRTVLSGGVRPR